MDHMDGLVKAFTDLISMALKKNPTATFDEIRTITYPAFKDDVIFNNVGLTLYRIELCKIAIEKERLEALAK